MANGWANNLATSSILTWSSQGAHLQHGPDDEVAAEVDEPPDSGSDPNSPRNQFKRTVVPRIADHSESLLTKALHQPSEDNIKSYHQPVAPARRRSLNSNISLASTTDLTSDTGFTSPTRTTTPSPPPPVITLAGFERDLLNRKQGVIRPGSFKRQAAPESGPTTTQPRGEIKGTTIEALQKKRCISFACGPKPEAKKSPSQSLVVKTASTAEEKAPRKTCIKFACPAQPAPRTEISKREQQHSESLSLVTPTKNDSGSSSLFHKHRSPSATRGRHQRSLTPQAINKSPATNWSSKYLTANANDLNTESSRFHEFASDEPLQEDWLLQNLPLPVLA
ncbi:hypothetical protein RRF57_005513 [Xylaria bambusicola]|uniref:Uncharacterized protein n=1 Tax=Xylaria bambusicola TaxID=326684 RepID=A0AAN7Z850_9PEZI